MASLREKVHGILEEKDSQLEAMRQQLRDKGVTGGPHQGPQHTPGGLSSSAFGGPGLGTGSRSVAHSRNPSASSFLGLSGGSSALAGGGGHLWSSPMGLGRSGSGIQVGGGGSSGSGGAGSPVGGRAGSSLAREPSFHHQQQQQLSRPGSGGGGSHGAAGGGGALPLSTFRLSSDGAELGAGLGSLTGVGDPGAVRNRLAELESQVRGEVIIVKALGCSSSTID
jgi:hypothetical protein